MNDTTLSTAGWPPPPGWPPEIPAPGEPRPGPPTTYPPLPMVYDTPLRAQTEDLRDRLLDRRIVLASGHLDHAAATDVAARLLFLDGNGDEPIELRYSCSDGELDAALTLADTEELLGVELRATSTGTVGGAAVLPFAVATRRLAHPSTRFLLASPTLDVQGSTTDVVADAARHAELLAVLHRRLAAATGQPADTIAADLAARRSLTAEEARDYGLVDEIAETRRLRAV